MAKKSRRPNIPESTLERARREMDHTPAVSAPAPGVPARSGEAAVKARPVARLSSADLRTEYEYVVSDLQSMGILAALFLGVLIVLSFVI